MLIFNHFLKVDFVFSQAEVFLSWKSLLLNNFFKDLNNALFELKDLVEKVWNWRLQQSKMLCSLILSILSIVGLLVCEMSLIHLVQLQPEVFSAGLSVAQSVSILLHVTKTESNCCKLPVNATEEDKRKGRVQLLLKRSLQILRIRFFLPLLDGNFVLKGEKRQKRHFSLVKV